ncbi:MAG: DUF2793 domain-containing protein [Rhizomicrobium sp.]
MSDTTPRTALPLLAAAQAQKHVTHNEALLQMDALLFARFLDRDLGSPPATPADGDTYLVAAGGAGAWTGQDGKIAFAADGGWRFYAPFTGLAAYVVDESRLIVFTGAAWADYASILSLQNVPLLGVNTTADATNKLATKSAALLFDNAGNGVQAKLNKHASGDTASLLCQTNYSGRAELGLCGDDDLHVKVSPDGAAWFEGLRIARGNGLVTLAGDPTAPLHAATRQYVDGLAKGWTAGSLLFGNGAGAIAQDNARLFWDDVNFRLGIGSASPTAALTVNPSGTAPPAVFAASALHIVGTNGASGGRAVCWDASGTFPVLKMRRTNGTYASPAAVAQDQTLANWTAEGHDGTGFAATATGAIAFNAAENFTPAAHGTYFIVQTAAAGSTFLVEAFRVWDDKRLQAGGAYVDLSYSYQTPATGFAITIANATGRLLLNPAGTLAAGAITMPAAPKDGQIVTLASTQTVTALTHSPNAGQSIAGALTTLAANTPASFLYVASVAKWLRT